MPQYAPEMLYEPDYVAGADRLLSRPLSALLVSRARPFSPASVTGAFWAAVVDWDDWGVWGGRWDGSDIDIDCNNCFNNREFNGKVNFNDVDWKNVDRTKINFDRNQLEQDRSRRRSRTASRRNSDNSIRDRAKRHQEARPVANRAPGKTTGRETSARARSTG